MATTGSNDEWSFYKDKRDEWRWRRNAPSGEIVGASTEGYDNKQDAVKNAERNGYQQ